MEKCRYKAPGKKKKFKDVNASHRYAMEKTHNAQLSLYLGECKKRA